MKVTIYLATMLQMAAAAAPYAFQVRMGNFGLFEYTVTNEFIDFQITGNTLGWVAWGLQNVQDQVKMVGAEAYVCAIPDGGQAFFKAWQLNSKNRDNVINNGKSPEIEALFSEVSGEEVNGKTICRGKRDIRGNDRVSALIRNSQGVLRTIWAQGTTDKINRHSNTERAASLVSFVPAGTDCFNACGSSGQCDSFCGQGNKCCRRYFNGGENGCDEFEGGLDKHVCVTGLFRTPPSANPNKPGDCFVGCDRRDGLCPEFCGQGNKCCKQGVVANGCNGNEGGSTFHTCVQEVVPEFGQCGGFGQPSKCCAPGSRCFLFNPFFSQCVKNCPGDRVASKTCESVDACVRVDNGPRVASLKIGNVDEAEEIDKELDSLPTGISTANHSDIAPSPSVTPNRLVLFPVLLVLVVVDLFY